MEETRRDEARQDSQDTSWNDEPLVSWPQLASGSPAGLFGLLAHAGTPIGSWPVRERGGALGRLLAALAGQAAVAFGTYPRPSRVSGRAEFGSAAITAAASRYLVAGGRWACEHPGDPIFC